MIVRANPRTRIHIGSTGENLATTVVFDISDWYKAYGDGEVNLIIEQDSLIYVQAVEKVLDEANNKFEVHWVVTNQNTQTSGVGKCELTYIVSILKDDGTEENLLKKSAVYEFVVTDSLGDENADPPEYAETWVEQVLKAAQNIGNVSEEAEQAIKAAGEAKEAATQAGEAAKTAAEAATEKKFEETITQINEKVDAAEASATAASNAATRAETFTTKPPMPYEGVWHIWNSETETYETTSEPAVLTIVKSYSSIEEMEADKPNMKENDLVIIASESIEDEDNSKLYILSDGNWKFLSDLSGTGSGIGDMKVDVYDPQGKATDIFDYIDKKVDNISSVVLRKWTAADFEEVEGE